MEYNNSTVYDLFNNPFLGDFGSPALNMPPITFDDRHRSHKRSRYTPDLIPDNISVASEDVFSTLTNPYDSPYLLFSDDRNTLHIMNIYVIILGRVFMLYWCGKNNQKRCYKNTRFYWSTFSDNNAKFYYCHIFPGLFQIQVLAYWIINNLCRNVSVDCCVCLTSILYFYLLKYFCAFFLPVPLIPILYFFKCLNACDDSPVRHIRCNYHIHSCKVLLKIGIIWWKKNSPLLTKSIDFCNK